MESFVSKNRLILGIIAGVVLGGSRGVVFPRIRRGNAWFLDRFRTTVNVWGDSIGAAVIEKLEPDENTG